MPKQDACHILPRAVYLEQGFFCFLLHHHGGGRQLTRSSLPMADPCSHDVTLPIAPSVRFQGIPHVSQRALFTRNPRREVRADDVTRTPDLHGFPCRPARVHRPRNPLRTFREQNMRNAARGASHTRSYVDPCLPNSTNTHRHFNRPHDGLFQNAGHSRTGNPSRKTRARGPFAKCRTGLIRGTGAVTKITLCGPPGSPLVSPVWIGPCTISMHALTHAMLLTPYLPSGALAPLTLLTTHTGARGFVLPQAILGFPYPPSSARARSQHSSAQPRSARPDSPCHDLLRERVFPLSVP